MRIFVINPNSSVNITNHLRDTLNKIKRSDCELTVVCPDHGPVSIESSYDETLAAYHMMPLVKRANDEKYDAIVIACFSDPGLDSAKEISDIPVIGIEEATLHIASMLGHKFSVMTGMSRRIPTREWHAVLRGVTSTYASSPALDMSVLEMDENPAKAKARIIEAARKAVEVDRAEVIVLGCAGLAGYQKDIEQELGVIVLDPSSVALKIAEAIVDLKVSHSKVGRFSHPPKKEIK